MRRKKALLIVLFIILICLVSVLAAFVIYKLLNRTNGQILSSGQTRNYLLYVPDNLDQSKPVPLVISLHGFIETPAHQETISRWNELADEYGFIVVYPQGTGFPLRWNANGQNGDEQDLQKDVQFISDLMDKMQSEYNIDPKRIFANGLSNGGGMSYVLACKLSERIAAIGGVAGAYSYPPDLCQPERPVPVIAFHGTADPIVPYEGGVAGRDGFTFPAIADWVKSWADRNGCDLNPNDIPADGDASGIRYSGCLDGSEVIFYTIAEGGHTWPGGYPMPEWITGPTSQDIDASQVMWDFYEKHPLP
jgi:polyhydroxybutyrate depolymerase